MSTYTFEFKELAKNIYNYRLDDEKIVKNTGEIINKIFKTFYSNLSNYSPDITGYTLFFLTPPHLSSPDFEKVLGRPDNLTSFFKYLNVAFPLLAIDINLPSFNVKVGEFSLRTGGIPMAEEVETTKEISVTYVETSNLHIYTLHSIWIEYIKEILKGKIAPANIYIEEGIIDYATCAYVLKFDLTGKLMYFGRLTGIFPVSLNPKDIIGSRHENTLSMVNVNYVCAFYNEFTYFELEKQGYSLDNPNGHEFLEDFVEKLSNFLKY